jgi:hypothetical protein
MHLYLPAVGALTVAALDVDVDPKCRFFVLSLLLQLRFDCLDDGGAKCGLGFFNSVFVGILLRL